MQCPCGSETALSSHEVKTLAKATEWYLAASDDVLPITIERDICPGCGRERRTITKGGEILHREG